jgi:hypothetical protein
MKRSALLVCGFAHTTGIAEKFGLAGFEVELHVYLENADDKAIEHPLGRRETLMWQPRS